MKIFRRQVPKKAAAWLGKNVSFVTYRTNNGIIKETGILFGKVVNCGRSQAQIETDLTLIVKISYDDLKEVNIPYVRNPWLNQTVSWLSYDQKKRSGRITDTPLHGAIIHCFDDGLRYEVAYASLTRSGDNKDIEKTDPVSVVVAVVAEKEKEKEKEKTPKKRKKGQSILSRSKKEKGPKKTVPTEDNTPFYMSMADIKGWIQDYTHDGWKETHMAKKQGENYDIVQILDEIQHERGIGENKGLLVSGDKKPDEIDFICPDEKCGLVESVNWMKQRFVRCYKHKVWYSQSCFCFSLSREFPCCITKPRLSYYYEKPSHCNEK